MLLVCFVMSLLCRSGDRPNQTPRKLKDPLPRMHLHPAFGPDDCSQVLGLWLQGLKTIHFQNCVSRLTLSL